MKDEISDTLEFADMAKRALDDYVRSLVTRYNRTMTRPFQEFEITASEKWMLTNLREQYANAFAFHVRVAEFARGVRHQYATNKKSMRKPL